MNKKGLAFNVLMAIFGLIALTITAVNFYTPSDKSNLGILTNQILRAGFNSERLKNYLDRVVLIESNNLTFELARLNEFEECFVYRGNTLWNQKSSQCFTMQKFKGYFNKTLNDNLKLRYQDYPFAFFDINYSFDMINEDLIGYPINRVSMKNLIKSIELRTNEQVKVPKRFTNVSDLIVSKDLFMQFLLLNYCDTEKIIDIHMNPEDFKFYIVGKGTDKGKECLMLVLKGNHKGVGFDSKEFDECGLTDEIELFKLKETNTMKLCLKK